MMLENLILITQNQNLKLIYKLCWMYLTNQLMMLNKLSLRS